MKRVLVLFGTRPEAIKLAPVVRVLRQYPAEFSTQIVSTGQHQEMVQQALDAFGLKVDVQLDVMSSAKSLGMLTGRLFETIDRVLDANNPEWIVVQGDTTSAMVGALCSFYRKIKVAHVEAGLRTGDRWFPFPEEVNRTIISHVADLNFAPTRRAADNLLGAGAPPNSIQICGNTVVDALLWISRRLTNEVPAELDVDTLKSIEGKRLVLVTAHRRESFGEGLERICRGLWGVVEALPDAVIVYPVHLNPNVRDAVYRIVGKHPRIRLLNPVGYLAFVWLMQRSYLILTDSGGIQEEAPTFGKPVVIMRDTTERPEVVDAGCAKLVGTDPGKIVETVCDLFNRADIYNAMASVKNPFGDGMAAERIVDALR